MGYWGTNVEQPPEVLALHNAYKGERLFVLGTGPSLREMPLEALSRLEGEHTFSTNKLALWLDLPFDPMFHGLSEHEDMSRLTDDLYDIGEEERFACAWAPIDVPGWQWVAKAPDSVNIWTDGMVGLGDDLPPLPSAASTPITLGVQLGAWMGFDPIYLLGCDNTTSGQVFANVARPSPHPEWTRMSAGRCHEALGATGRKLIDCTPGGELNRLGFLQYHSLEEVLGLL
jgi:hypothetical protein